MLEKSVKLRSRLLSVIQDSPFVKHNLVFFVGSLVVSALNYLFYPVMGRLMPPAEFGEVQTLLSLFAQFAVLLSILTYVTIHITVNTENKAERNRLLLGLENAVLGGGVIILGISLLFVQNLKSFLNFESVWPFVALIVAFGISIPLIIRVAFLRGQKLFAKATLTDAINSAAKLVLATILVIIGLSSFGAILGLVISQIIALVLGLRWAHAVGFSGFGIKKNSFKFKTLQPQLKYASAVFLVATSITATLSLDMIAVKHYFDPEQAGLYAGVTTTAKIVFFLITPFTGVLITLINLKQSARMNVLRLKGTLALAAGLGGITVLIMAWLSDLVIKIFVGPKYLEYAHYLPILGLAMLLLSIGNTLLMYQIALKRYSYCIPPIISTILLLFLLYFRNASIDQIVDNVLFTSLALVVLTAVQSTFYKILRLGEK